MSSCNIIKKEEIKEGKIAVTPIKHQSFDNPSNKNKKSTNTPSIPSIKEIKYKQESHKPLSKADRTLLQAETILSNAKKRVAEIEREAYEKGFTEGEKAGLELGRKKLEPIIKNIDNLAQQITKIKEELIKKNEAELIKIAFLIASKVVHYKIYTNDETIMNIARTTLEKMIKGGKVTMRVNQIDYQYLLDNKSSIPELAEFGESLIIERDPSICRGGCVITTNAGEIDATIENQLNILKNAMLIEE